MSEGASMPSGPHGPQDAGVGAAGSAGATFEPAPTRTWRIRIDGLPRPFPLLKSLTIGSDDRAGLQLAHGSIRPLHARLTIRGNDVLLEAVGDAPIRVSGAKVDRALLRGDERVHVGDIQIHLEPVAPGPVTVFSQPSSDAFVAEFRSVLMRELRRLQWLTISIAIHAVAFWVASKQQSSVRVPIASTETTITLSNRPPSVDLDLEDDVDATPTDPDTATELPDPTLSDLIDPPALDSPTTNDLPPTPDEIGSSSDFGHRSGIGVGRGGGRGGRGGDGFGGPGVNLGRVGAQFGEKLAEFRSRGVDLVFMIDTTASMDPFLASAKRTVDEIITRLALLVPSLRLGIVAYRDEGDEYVTRAIPLSADRYAILNFLETLEARGGGDVPEDVQAAADYALDEMNWRKNSHRVMILVADAPPHPEDDSRLRQRLHRAALARPATVTSVIFTGAGQFSLDRQADAEKSLKALATAGGGEYANFENDDRAIEQMVSIAFGTQSRTMIAKLMQERTESPKAALVAPHVANRDLDWLLQKLSRVPVEPAVVDGLIQIRGPQVAMRCWRIVNDSSADAATREAALYVLRRITRFEGAIDFAKPLEVQESAVGKLQQAVETTFRPNRRRDGH